MNTVGNINITEVLKHFQYVESKQDWSLSKLISSNILI